MERLTYTVEEVARMIGCSPRTVVREIQRGRLSVIRVGRLVRIPTQTLTAYVSGTWRRPPEPAEAREGAQT
jgi:excisionase family DNA binding protein